MGKITVRLLNSRFIKNTGWMVFAQIYQMVIQLIIGVISARYLGPSNYGIISYAASYISFFTIISALGLESIVVKEMINNRGEEGVILGSSIFYRFIAGILSMISVCVLVYAVNPEDNILLIVTFLQSLALLFNAFQVIDAWYQSLLKSKVSTIIKCISYTTISIYKIFLLVTGKSVLWFAFSTSLDSIIIAILYMIRYRKDGIKTLKVKRSVGNRLLRQSYHLIISYLMASIYNQIDKIMIGKMIGQIDVGFYAAASTIARMWMFIPQAFTNSAQPLIMDLKNNNKEVYEKRIKQLTCLIFWIGMLFALIITIASKFIINVLYGEAYYSARTPLMISIWSMAFSSMSYPRSVWMISENKQSYVKKIMMWGVIVNLVLNFLWIPKYGINGAATATLITEIICCLIAPAMYKETRVYVRYLLSSIIGKF